MVPAANTADKKLALKISVSKGKILVNKLPTKMYSGNPGGWQIPQNFMQRASSALSIGIYVGASVLMYSARGRKNAKTPSDKLYIVLLILTYTKY